MTAAPCRLERDWHAFDAYLFDIDGTLLHCADAVHYFAFCDALSWVAGRSMNLDGVTAHGNTDIGILRDAFALAAVPDDAWRPRLDAVCERMCRFVAERKRYLCITAMAGALDMVRCLKRRGAVVGVATGNLQSIGQCKLEAARFAPLIDFGGWSDGLEFRADVFARAALQARELAGNSARLLVVGDTPADVAAARSNGLPVVAVASGIYGFGDLSACGPDLCIQSLEELVASA
jgi:phosphoglycolate phosphatase-like HAD superfamily hydrolase